MLSKASTPTRSDTSSLTLSPSAPSTPPLTREPTEELMSSPRACTPVEESQILDVPTERIKITASNGWKVLHKLRVKKRVKRDHSIDEEELGKVLSAHSFKRVPTRGKLGALLSLPMDVLFEIFGHLSPQDILHLARTTKNFRSVLMHRSAMSVWKSAFNNDHLLPTCPEDTPLPAWANLLFDAHCHICLASNVRSVEWTLRMRVCNKCAKKWLEPEDAFNHKKKRDKIILRCIPLTRRKDGTKYCYIPEKEAFSKELHTHKGDRTQFVEKKQSEMKARNEHARECQSWELLQSWARDDELNAARRDRYDFIQTKLVHLGYHNELEFLLDYDSGEHMTCPLPDITPFREHEEVRPAKPITERMWNNRVKDIMVEYMEEVRIHHLKNERNLILRKRRSVATKAWIEWRANEAQIIKYPSDYLMPTVVDVVESPLFQPIINQKGSAKLTADSFKEAFEMIDKFIIPWRKLVFDGLFKAVFSKIPGHVAFPKTEAQCVRYLELAVFVFKCSNTYSTCHENVAMKDDETWKDTDVFEPEPYTAMWYPQYIYHGCNTYITQPYEEQHLEENVFYQVKRYSSIRRTSWTPKHLEFDVKASTTVNNILTACGLDWYHTTAEDMDHLDLRVVCLKCSFGQKCDGERRFRVMTWRNAVKHALKIHWGASNVQWEKVSDEDAAKARILESNEYARRSIPRPDEEKPWRCVLCRDSPGEPGRLTLEEVREHIENKHDLDPSDLDEPGAEGKIFYRAMDNAPRQPLNVTMIPKSVGKPPTPSAPTST